MSPTRHTRRDVLAGLALPLAGVLAGCDGVLADDGTPTPASYDHLADRQVYVADELDRSAPAPIETVNTPDAAAVVVLPATTDLRASTAVDWIEDGTRVVLVGDRSQATWLGWQDSESYRAAYPDHRGRAESCAHEGSSRGDADAATDCEPPDVLVGWDPTEGPPTTHRRTWGGTDDPSDEQVFAVIDASYEEW